MVNNHREQRYTLFQFPVSPISFPPKEYIFWINTKCIYSNLNFFLPISLKISMPDSSSSLGASLSLTLYSVSGLEHFPSLNGLSSWYTFLKTVTALCKSHILGSSHCTGTCWTWEWPDGNKPQIFQVSLPCPCGPFSGYHTKNLNSSIQGAMLFSSTASIPWTVKLSLPTQVTW